MNRQQLSADAALVAACNARADHDSRPSAHPCRYPITT